MSAKERAALVNKLFKVAKKHFQEVKPPSGRTILEHVVYACCLEDSLYVAADEVFARLQADYYDWNEVRVTTAKELAEVCKPLAHPENAAVRIKKALHGIFETYYDFNIDVLKKENLGKTVTQFQQFRGVSPFVISYMAQHGLGGHSIPVDKALLNLMYIIGAISEAELAKSKVPGLERTIPKSKGVEFASVVHQLAAQFHKSKFDKDLRDVLLSISKSAADRFPKRGGKKKAAAKADSVKADSVKTKSKTKAEKTDDAKPVKKSKAADKPAAAKKKAAASKVTKKAATPTKKKAAKKSPAKKAASKKQPPKNQGQPRRRALKSQPKKLL